VAEDKVRVHDLEGSYQELAKERDLEALLVKLAPA